MKIPKKLKIGAHLYDVRIVQEGKVLSLSGDAGICQKQEIIEINGAFSQSQQGASLIHEIMHALNAQWDVNDTMHALMEATSQQLYQVLADNKMLR